MGVLTHDVLLYLDIHFYTSVYVDIHTSAGVTYLLFSRYSWLGEDEMLSLPVDRMLEQEGLVAIWVTNKRKLVELVRERLFPSWGVQPLAEWLWLKVSNTGRACINTVSDLSPVIV